MVIRAASGLSILANREMSDRIGARIRNSGLRQRSSSIEPGLRQTQAVVTRHSQISMEVYHGRFAQHDD